MIYSELGSSLRAGRMCRRTGTDQTETLNRITLLGERRHSVDPCRRGVGVSIEILNVREVGARVSKPSREGVANLVNGERLAAGLPGSRLIRFVGALGGPGPEGVGGDEVVDGGEGVGHQGNGGQSAALTTGYAHIRNGVRKAEVGGGEPTHLGGRMPVQCMRRNRAEVFVPGDRCSRITSMCARSTHRGRGSGSGNRTRSSRSMAARRPYKTRTKCMRACRRWLQVDAVRVRRQSCNWGLTRTIPEGSKMAPRTV